MRLAAISIPENSLPHIFGERHEEQTLNFDEEISEEFWGEYITMVSAIVGKNGTGKSSILRSIKENYQMKSYDSHGNIIYYSPHLDYGDIYTFDVDQNDISLDMILRRDLENIIDDEKETGENGWNLNLKQDLEHFNTARQMDFLSSKLRDENPVFSQIFEGLKFDIGSVVLRGSNKIKITNDSFDNTPYQFRQLILDIFSKCEEEIHKWHEIREMHGNKVSNQHKINTYIFKRNIISSFLTIAVNLMERLNSFLEYGLLDKIEINDKTAIDLFYHFIKNAKVYPSRHSSSKARLVFNSKVIELFEYIYELVEDIIDEESISNKSFNTSYDNLERIMSLQKEIITHLSKNYYNQKTRVSEFLAFKSTDRKLSSGENALLNFYSVLYEFTKQVDGNEIYDEYILLLDEADLGYHPEWKKRFVNSIVKSLPSFFSFPNKQAKIQIIFSTHDPLTLSDIPKQNVVFLDKDSNGLTTISSQNKETFGANIHDLLADSFFVGDGLIGEFAKEKVLDLIRYLTFNEELEESENNIKCSTSWDKYTAYKLIQIIGEPVIKERLLSLYDLKFREETKESLEKQMIELQLKLSKFK